MPGNACIRLPPWKPDPFDGGRPELRSSSLHAGAGKDCCAWNKEERRGAGHSRPFRMERPREDSVLDSISCLPDNLMIQIPLTV